MASDVPFVSQLSALLLQNTQAIHTSLFRPDCQAKQTIEMSSRQNMESSQSLIHSFVAVYIPVSHLLDCARTALSKQQRALALSHSHTPVSCKRRTSVEPPVSLSSLSGIHEPGTLIHFLYLRTSTLTSQTCVPVSPDALPKP